MKKLYLIIAGVVLVSLAVVVFVNNRKYLVTFDSNGGTPIESMKVKKGGTIEQPSNPTKEGSIFIGWTENGKAFSFSTKITKNIILTAAWQEIKENVETYTVKFDSDGGSAILDQVVEKGKLVKKPEDPVKDKYTFICWTLNDVDYDFSEAVNSDIVLKAKWEQKKEAEDKNNLTNDNNKKSTKKTNSTTATNNSKQETNNKTNTQITLSTPILTERGRGGDTEQFGIIYKITNVESTDGIEVYKSTIGSNYLLEATLPTSKLAQINSEIQIVAKTNEHNYYKVRSYKVEDGAKKYSDYSAVVEVVGPTLSTPLLTEEGRGADINEAGILYKVENVGYADGIEIYKSNNTNDYQLLKSMAMAQLEQAESKILVTAGLGEHNYYKVRSYKVVDGVKKYSDYSTVVDVSH